MHRQSSPSAPDHGREVPFAAEDLIYSRTDDRGVIRAANSVFQRLSGYDWSDLIGAPHRIVRHPDMPKGFFHIFWSQLKKGEPAVGYVKNRSKDGRYYWVLANAIPCPGGFFSIRIRAASEVFDLIRREYVAVVQREQQENLRPEASAAVLLQRLNDLGFEDYPHFMSHAIEKEVQCRSAAIGRDFGRDGRQISDVVDRLVDAIKEQAHLVTRFRDLMLLPVNMRLVAARLEPQGGPISQISMNYKSASDEIGARLASFVSGDANLCRRMVAAVRRSLVLNRCAQLQSEMVGRYDRYDPAYAGIDRRVELQAMQEAESVCTRLADEGLAQSVHLAGELNDASADVRRMILGLDTIRILGRVESRRDLAAEASMSATIDQIDRVQGEISDSLKRLSDQAAFIHAVLIQLRRPRTGSAVAAE